MWTAQQLVGKTDTVCLISDSVHEECNLCSCIVGMGIGKNRGHQRDHDGVLTGGHAHVTDWEGPKIGCFVFASL